MQFCCPTCKNKLVHSASEVHSTQDTGYLSCENCQTVTPVINGITFFTETDISIGEDRLEQFDSLNKSIENKRDEYVEFIAKKVSKDLVDPYSAFQPFNESSRSFYPFISSLKSSVLKPNDVILDTWCRTGWSAFFLAGMFPEQQIVSVWEGNRDVLGYQGFDYWLSAENKPENLTIIFHDVNKALPIEDDSIKLVYGLDTLHRYNQSVLVSELLRVTSNEGVIVWPHIHLTNSEPKPFFERGEKQLHGTDYDRYFNRLLESKKRKAYILSEPKMFSLDQRQSIYNDPNTTDYNALIAILPETLDFELSPYAYRSEEFSSLRTLVNPYLKINLNNQKVTLDPSYLNGVVGVMLDRHPIYHRKIEKAAKFRLTEVQSKVIYLAEHGYTNSEIVDTLQISTEAFFTEVEELVEAEIIHMLPLSNNAVNLQLFHGARFKPSKPSTHSLWKMRNIANKQFEKQSMIVNAADGSELTKEDSIYLINSLKNRLADLLSPDDIIFISSKPHFESILLFWAATEIGIEVCILSTEMPMPMKCELIQDHKPKKIFVDSVVYKQLSSENIEFDLIVFDEDVQGISEEILFSSWLDHSDTEPEFDDFKADSRKPAVTLFTSGTTGKPKGIRLSHASLYRSGQVLSETYEWNQTDRLLMVSELDSMSGLRNVCIATQFCGVSIVIPNFNDTDPHIFSIIEAIQKHDVSLLSATPALVKQLIQLGDRIKKDIRSLRQVICTGGNLSPKLVSEFRDLFDIQVLNYYGLTETTGLCIGVVPNEQENMNGSIGVSIDSIAQIVSEDGELLKAGEVGRLRIFNDRLMSGYLNPNDSSNLHMDNGWLYTGDLAYVNDEGHYFLKARERDIIKDHAGNVIYLSEVEDCISTHPKVKEAAVCQMDDIGMEYLGAFVIPEDIGTEDFKADLKSFISENIGPNKVPKFIEFLEEFPETSRGKIDKKSLKANYLNVSIK